MPTPNYGWDIPPTGAKPYTVEFDTFANQIDATVKEVETEGGRIPENVLLVDTDGTDVQRGTALIQAYQDAKTKTPYGKSLGEDNQVYLYLDGGVYDLEDQKLVLDTDFINIIGDGICRRNNWVGVPSADDLTLPQAIITGNGITDDVISWTAGTALVRGVHLQNVSGVFSTVLFDTPAADEACVLMDCAITSGGQYGLRAEVATDFGGALYNVHSINGHVFEGDDFSGYAEYCSACGGFATLFGGNISGSIKNCLSPWNSFASSSGSEILAGALIEDCRAYGSSFGETVNGTIKNCELSGVGKAFGWYKVGSTAVLTGCRATINQAIGAGDVSDGGMAGFMSGCDISSSAVETVRVRTGGRVLGCHFATDNSSNEVLTWDDADATIKMSGCYIENGVSENVTDDNGIRFLSNELGKDHSSSYVIEAKPGFDDVSNGANFLAALALARLLTPNKAPFGVDARVKLKLRRGNYDIGSGATTLITLADKYLDIEGEDPAKFLGWKTGENITADDIQHAGTRIVGSCTGESMVVQTVDDMRISNIFFENLTDEAAYEFTDATDNHLKTVMTGCSFRHDDTTPCISDGIAEWHGTAIDCVSEGAIFSFFPVIGLDGYFKDCAATEGPSFGPIQYPTVHGVIEGCAVGDTVSGGDFMNQGTLSATGRIIGCVAVGRSGEFRGTCYGEYVDCVVSSFWASGGGILSFSFENFYGLLKGCKHPSFAGQFRLKGGLIDGCEFLSPLVGAPLIGVQESGGSIMNTVLNWDGTPPAGNHIIQLQSGSALEVTIGNLDTHGSIDEDLIVKDLTGNRGVLRNYSTNAWEVPQNDTRYYSPNQRSGRHSGVNGGSFVVYRYWFGPKNNGDVLVSGVNVVDGSMIFNDGVDTFNGSLYNYKDASNYAILKKAGIAATGNATFEVAGFSIEEGWADVIFGAL